MTTPWLSDSWSGSITATSHMNTTETPWTSMPLYIALQYLRVIYPALVLVFGILGNATMVIIMVRTTSSESSIHVYFMATAVFDTLFLCTGTLPQWTRWTFGVNILSTHSVICKLFTWLYTGCGTISAWCLVCMNVHRAMSVLWPHRVNVLCTRRTVLLVLAGVTVFLALLYSHYMVAFQRVYVASIDMYLCTVDSDHKKYLHFLSHVFVFIELSVYCLLPFLFLVLSNSALVWKLCVSVRSVDRKLAPGDSGLVQSREKAANAVTVTVVAVSLAFVVLTLPTSLLFILNYVTTPSSESRHEFLKKTFITIVFILLSQTNNAVNFYVYCLTGRRFREVLKVLCCGRNRRRRGVSR